MTIESQDDVITCCNREIYKIIHLGYIFFIWIGLIGLQISIGHITIDGMFQQRLVDIHVFICSMGGVWMLGSITAITLKDETLNEKKTGAHSVFGFPSTIVITVGTALLYGNTTHAYPCHSIAGFTCAIAVWIQMILGCMILKENPKEKVKLGWAKAMHTVLGLATVISGSLCFITGFGTVWFLTLYSFLSDPLSVYAGFSGFTAFLTLLILFIPLYRLTREGLRYFRRST